MVVPLSDYQESRTVAKLLTYDAMYRAQARDIDGAVQSCHAAVNVARSAGDDMVLISLLVRVADRAIATRQLERVLAQGEPSAAVLAELQHLLAEEEKEPLLYYGARGERAYSHTCIEHLRSGKGSLAGLNGPSPLNQWKVAGLSLEDIASPFLYGPIADNGVANLQFTTKFVEIGRKPPEEQYSLIQELDATIPSQPIFVRLMAPAFTKVNDAFRRSMMDLRCAIVMLAVERYRLENGRWPASLDELVGKYLTKVPIDLYEGAPLRFRRLEDRIVIYSVGPDGKDDGGNVDPRKYPVRQPGSDLGFRLWDVPHRRQAPLPQPVSRPDTKGDADSGNAAKGQSQGREGSNPR